MTDHALERRLGATAVLLAMAVDAPAHAQPWWRQSEADEVQQVVAERAASLGAHHAHSLDRPVAGLARDTGTHVRLVREVRELRNLEDADPRNRLTATGVLVDLGDLGIVLSSDDLVATHATLDRRQSSGCPPSRLGVAVLTGELERAGVHDVVEEDRLGRRVRRRRDGSMIIVAERRLWGGVGEGGGGGGGGCLGGRGEFKKKIKK